jgi:exopolysaccharide biosynthesis protein
MRLRPRSGRVRVGRRVWGAAYSVALALFTAYVLLDAFVIPRRYAPAADGAVATATPAPAEGQEAPAVSVTPTPAAPAATTAPTITLTSYRVDDTDIYVADLQLTSVGQLHAALAEDTYGRNITAPPSEIAAAHGAAVAINGDFYGARTSGYVLRDGVLYRDRAASADQEDLVIWADGSATVIREGDVTAAQLADQGAWQVFGFGPGLVEDGAVTVGPGDEVDKAMASNPRTAIGVIAPLHYVFVVADGRTSASAGLSLAELAAFMAGQLGVETAFNLDGGGSSTLWSDGAVVNVPTTNGRKSKERAVSDIVYVA